MRSWAEESGSASEGGGARDERQVPWQGSGPQDPEALPGEPERHAQPRLPERRGAVGLRAGHGQAPEKSTGNG